MDQDLVWKQADRVLKDGGAIAVWGYDMPRIKGNEEASQAIIDYHNSMWAGGYWEANRKLVDDHYAHLRLPYENNFVTFVIFDCIVI